MMNSKNKRVMKYGEEYDIIDEKLHDMEGIAEDLIEYAEQNDMGISKDKDQVKHMMDLDIRENIPPQMYEIICSVVEMIERLEK